MYYRCHDATMKMANGREFLFSFCVCIVNSHADRIIENIITMPAKKKTNKCMKNIYFTSLTTSMTHKKYIYISTAKHKQKKNVECEKMKRTIISFWLKFHFWAIFCIVFKLRKFQYIRMTDAFPVFFFPVRKKNRGKCHPIELKLFIRHWLWTCFFFIYI